ncbi:MAG: phosphosugar isomerase [Acidimicrobiaceae bacterium]|nr:phosphosugar isomerase [Acidimicrobiaceae bacterium]
MSESGERVSRAAEEIESQPGCWVQAAELAGEVAGALPQAGERVAAVGCGTSHNIAKAYAQLRERAGLGETDAFASSEVSWARRYDRMLFFSRTGTTTETLQALRRAPKGMATTTVTARPKTPLGEEAGQVVSLEFADEEAVIQTRYATSAIVLLRVHLGEGSSALVEAAEDALARSLPEGALDARQHTFLGRGWTAAIADEATLKLRETAQVWAEAHNAMEYRHGPISLAEPGFLVWCFGEPPAALADEVRATGARWEQSPADPLAELIRAQRLAVMLAEGRGLNPDSPRGLRHSIVLSGLAGEG